jgi:hypothetical protein
MTLQLYRDILVYTNLDIMYPSTKQDLLEDTKFSKLYVPRTHLLVRTSRCTGTRVRRYRYYSV